MTPDDARLHTIDSRPARPLGSRVTPELIILHRRQAHRLHREALHAAMRACVNGVVTMAWRALRTMRRRRGRHAYVHDMSVART